MLAVMKTSFRNLGLDAKVNLLLSGLHSEVFIHDWADLMTAICEFDYDIYHQRKLKYDVITLNGVTYNKCEFNPTAYYNGRSRSLLY